ncbi:hypothetical protein ACUXCC_005638 [Cytobacillus horneckiae]|uniref:hypothetical protein n=1 Tax=Cytobacillus horneckiae TaxID=549687 RepID=UPI0019D22C7F|nr:hypothetical protein [Cytobacillus horneckiae]MBN6890105.1 hypothetical protein [Cytobacillus horneckiae]
METNNTEIEERLENLSPLAVAMDGNILVKPDDWFWLQEMVDKQQQEIERLKKYEISHAELQLFAGYCLNDLFENGGSMCEEWKTFIKRTRDRMLELQDI